jgi:hypothetical protein
MFRHRWIIGPLFAALALVVAACGGGDDTSAGGASGGAEEAPAGEQVQVSGSGWTATFPGEVQETTETSPLPDGSGSVTSNTTTWESASEGITIVTTDLPETSMANVDAAAMLAQTASSGGRTVISDSPVLDDDGSFRGREAVAFEVAQDDLVITGVAFVDGARLYQVITASPDGGTATLESLLDSFEFAA